MANLNHLISEFCPNGVEHKPLRDIADFLNGKAHESDIALDGKYVVVNSKFVSTNGQIQKFTNTQICPVKKMMF